MKKEVVIAIIVGFSLGLVITYGVYRAKQSIQNQAAKDEATLSEAIQLGEPSLLSITQPEDGAITDQDAIVIGGITQGNALVTLVSVQDHQITQADEIGNFSSQISLASGPNTITVSSFDQDGNQQTATHTIVYSTYDFDTPGTEE